MRHYEAKTDSHTSDPPQRQVLPRMGVSAWLLLALLAGCGGSDVNESTSRTANLNGDGCQQYTLPVTLAPGSSTTYNLVGWLCGATSADQTVLLLVHGATYDHNYWDFPLQGQLYSFVRRALLAGYATFNIDRLGDGLSDHPAPELLTIDAHAYVVHQLVQTLRSGAVGFPYSKVALVGHSMGSAMIQTEAANYHDADGLVVTGALHHLNPDGFALGIQDLYPAFLDPKFASNGYPAGYFTSVPGKRAELFYYTQTADPDIIAKDEELKQLTSIGELTTIAASALSPATLSINVPVISLVGQFDLLMCGGDLTCTDQNVAAFEAPFYSAAACLETNVFQSVGHDLNLHYPANAVYSAAITWLNRRVGSSSAHPPTMPCQ